MFMFAYDLIRDYRPISKKEIVMVGDTLQTDIIGGNKFGLDTVLVLTGQHTGKTMRTVSRLPE
jgi:ribonucleotide monophosphatase NagD (HAD superfamily)